MRVPVVVQAWQYDCCGTDFAVGDVVRWRLGVDLGTQRDALDTSCPDFDVVLPIADRFGARGDEPPGCLLALGDLHAFLPDEGGPTADPVRRVRLLVEDHHGQLPARLPETVGTVATLREVRRAYGEGGRPVPGASVLRYAHRAVRGLRAESGRTFAGFLAELDVDTG